MDEYSRVVLRRRLRRALLHSFRLSSKAGGRCADRTRRRCSAQAWWQWEESRAMLTSGGTMRAGMTWKRLLSCVQVR